MMMRRIGDNPDCPDDWKLVVGLDRNAWRFGPGEPLRCPATVVQIRGQWQHVGPHERRARFAQQPTTVCGAGHGDGRPGVVTTIQVRDRGRPPRPALGTNQKCKRCRAPLELLVEWAQGEDSPDRRTA